MLAYANYYLTGEGGTGEASCDESVKNYCDFTKLQDLIYQAAGLSFKKVKIKVLKTS